VLPTKKKYIDDVDSMNEYNSESPHTPAEWQATVDAAQALLALNAARQYGLIAGGPRINVPRCQELLELGEARGFRPLPDVKDRILSEILPL
jgi:hypothetical protein